MKFPICFASAGDYNAMAVRLFKTIRHVYPDAMCCYDAIDAKDWHLPRILSMDVRVFCVEDLSLVEHWPFREHKPALCNNWRIVQIPHLLDQHHLPVMWLDSDTVVRSKFDGMLEVALDGYDMAVAARSDQGKFGSDRNRILGGVLLFMDTPKARDVLRCWSQKMGQPRKRGDWRNQARLWEAIQEVQPRWLPLDPDDFGGWRAYSRGEESCIISWPRGVWHKAGWNKLSAWAEDLNPL